MRNVNGRDGTCEMRQRRDLPLTYSPSPSASLSPSLLLSLHLPSRLRTARAIGFSLCASLSLPLNSMTIGTHRLSSLWSSLQQLPPSHCRPPLWSRRPQLPPSLSLHPPPETHQSLSLLLSLCHSICVEMCCLDADYDYYVKLLRLFYLADGLIPDSLESGRTALGVLQAATALCSNSISQICIEYLEAVPREDKEEEAILKVVSGLGPSAMSILARIQLL